MLVQCGLVMKAHNVWRDIGRSQVAVHRNYHLFLIICFFFVFFVYTVKLSIGSLSGPRVLQFNRGQRFDLCATMNY